MASEESTQKISVEAGADLSALQYYFVTVAADAQVDATGNGARAVGVLQNKPSAAGRAAEIVFGGVSKVAFGATVASGDPIASDAAGKCVAAATGDIVLGTCLVGGASGEIGRALIGGATDRIA